VRGPGVESNDSAEKLPQHTQKTLGICSLVTHLFRRKLWECGNRRYSPIYRAAVDAALGDSSAVRALHPRPKEQGFPRKMDKIGLVAPVLHEVAGECMSKHMRQLAIRQTQAAADHCTRWKRNSTT
jgi:hypothetical protein